MFISASRSVLPILLMTSSRSLESSEEGPCLAERTYNARNDFYETLGKNPFRFGRPPLIYSTILGSYPCYWPQQNGWIEFDLFPEGENLATGHDETNEDNTSSTCSDKGILVVTNGLSDTWDENSPVDFSEYGFPSPNLGYGFELIFGTMDNQGLSSEAMRSAAMQVAETLAAEPFGRLELFQDLANDELYLIDSHPEFSDKITGTKADSDAQMPPIGSMSMEVDGTPFPEHLHSKTTGNVGIVISSVMTSDIPSYFSVPEGKVYLFEMTLLHPEELGHIITCHLPARVEIMKRLRSMNKKWRSSSERPSVVPVPPPEKICDSLEEAVQMVKSWPPM